VVVRSKEGRRKKEKKMGVLKNIHIDMSEKLATILEDYELSDEDHTLISNLQFEHDEGEDICESLFDICNKDKNKMPNGVIACLREVLQMLSIY
jgi:hypothetical protein